MLRFEVIGKNVLGSKGFCYIPWKMGTMEEFKVQLEHVTTKIPKGYKIVSTNNMNSGMWSPDEDYIPKIVDAYSEDNKCKEDIMPEVIYNRCLKQTTFSEKPVDFVFCNDRNTAVITFSQDQPILVFKDNSGSFAVGSISRKSLINHGEQLFKEIKQSMKENVQVFLLVYRNYLCKDGNIEKIVLNYAKKYEMQCIKGYDTKKKSHMNKEIFYNKKDSANHVVVVYNQ